MRGYIELLTMMPFSFYQYSLSELVHVFFFFNSFLDNERDDVPSALTAEEIKQIMMQVGE